MDCFKNQGFENDGFENQWFLKEGFGGFWMQTLKFAGCAGVATGSI